MSAATQGVGRSRFDRFYDYDELPADEQQSHDWARGTGEQFVRYIYRSGRQEYAPVEHFLRSESGCSPCGRKADGFAADSYFSGMAIRLLDRRESRERGDADYEVWPEYT